MNSIGSRVAGSKRREPQFGTVCRNVADSLWRRLAVGPDCRAVTWGAIRRRKLADWTFVASRLVVSSSDGPENARSGPRHQPKSSFPRAAPVRKRCEIGARRRVPAPATSAFRRRPHPVAEVAKTSDKLPTTCRRRDQNHHPANGVPPRNRKRFFKREVTHGWPWISIFMEVSPAIARRPGRVGVSDEWHVDLRKPNLKNGLREVRICAFWPLKHA